MTTIQSLPIELLEAIINSLDSADQVARCSLVSKQWNRLANNIMHTKMISVKSESGALKLYAHLYKYQFKIPCIKHLHFELDSDKLAAIIKELLKLTIHKNIKILSGFVKSDVFFNLLFKIIKNFDQLVELPRYIGTNIDLTIEPAFKYKNLQHGFTLRVGISRSIRFQRLLSQLDIFKNLTYLGLTGFVHGLEGAEYVLCRSSNLKTLEFGKFKFIDIISRRLSTEEVYSWAEENNVTKEKSLQTLVIESDCCPQFIEYLLYKYPNITNVEVKGLLSFFLTPKKANRIFKAMKRVPCKKLIIVMHLPWNYVKASVVSELKKFNNEILAQIEEFEGETYVVLSHVSNKRHISVCPSS